MKFTNAYKYTMILVFLLLTSCSPSLEYTGVGGDILSPITNLFTIEAEKSGTPFDTETQTIRVGESLDLYFRDSIGSTENTDKLMATWSLFNGPGTMLVQEGGLSVRYNATSAGTVEVHAEHDDIKKYVIITILPAATSPTNTPPTISENCLNFFPGEDYKCQLSISDNDSSSFVWSEISDSCNYFSLNKSTGEITGTIPINPLPTCSLTIKANDGIDDSNQLAISINEQLCPTGYVPVPGNETLGTTSFCVMQFEAKNVSGVATSQAGSTPWGFIDSSTAFSECSSLSESGFDGNFSLISNRERMTINYNIENEAMNWSGGVVGSGHIPRGHSDNNPAIYLDVADINDPYIGTGNWSGQTPGAGWEQKRVHVMNNGYQIWDLAGNLWEWADWDHKKSGLTLSPNHNEAGVLNELSVNPSGSLNTLEYKPINDTYGTANSFGTWRAGGVAGAIIRGGFKDSDSNSIPGLYTFLITTPTHSYSNFGFRCVYRPSQPPVAQNFSAPNPYENTERIITLDYYDVNYNQASSCTIENLTNVTETTPCTCDGSGVCTVGITGITNYSGPASFEFNVIADGLKSNNAQANFSINGSIACPTGFVHVIGNASLGTDDFCVMQFEAKNNAGTPISQASGTPWVNISATNAFNECASMTESGFNGEFALISNPEWMTIARDIENSAVNWSGGSITSGMLNTGHSDNSPANALPVSNLNDHYSETGNSSGEAIGSGWEQKRVHTLSTSENIWDFAGNAWEWCDFNLNVSNFQIFPSSCSQVWNEINDTCGLLTPDDIQSHDNTLTSSSGIGQLYGGSARAAIRGGGYLNSSTTSGIYSLGLNNGQGFSHSSTGFRCVYRP